MKKPVFRQQAIDARKTEWLGTIRLRTPRLNAFMSVLAFVPVALLIVLLVFGRYTRHERVRGELVPSGGLLNLASPSAGTVARCFVSEGQLVTEGESVIEIKTGLSSVAVGDTSTVIAEQLKGQHDALEADLSNQGGLANQRALSLNERLLTLRRQADLVETMRSLKDEQVRGANALVERMQPLREKGVIAIFQFEKQQSEAIDVQAQLKAVMVQKLELDQQISAVQGEVAALPAAEAAKRNDIERKLADVSQAMARNEAERAIVLRAPRSGVVAGMTTALGQNLASGQRLMSFIPANSKLEAELWVPSRAIGFLSVGDEVVLRYDAYPYQKFGQYAGHIVSVARSATLPSELDSLRGRSSAEPMYRVLVALRGQSVAAFGKSLELKPSMTLDADVLLERRRLIEWIISPLLERTQPLPPDSGSAKTT
jgi:membrane fusion protein